MVEHLTGTLPVWGVYLVSLCVLVIGFLLGILLTWEQHRSSRR
jgi:hypothetical protein